jgi:NADH-quinone oxidoreductase subunit M
MLYLYWRMAYGVPRTAEAATLKDLNVREWSILAPIAAGVLWMGIYPESFMAPMRQDVGVLLARIERAAPPSDSNLAMGAARPAPAAAADHGAEGAH